VAELDPARVELPARREGPRVLADYQSVADVFALIRDDYHKLHIQGLKE
jgi:hypothetical protein